MAPTPTHAALAPSGRRDTVIDRMKHIEQLPGRSLQVPRDRLLLILGLMAVGRTSRAPARGGVMRRTVEDVVDRLVEIDEELPAHDGVAVFNRMYLTVTERVLSAVETPDIFRDAGFMAELDVRFADLWIQAYDDAAAGRPVCKAWRPLFEHRAARGLVPIQFALSGMNAHIEHDLPLAVVETCKARRGDPGRGAVRADYDVINDILASVEADVRRSFLSETGRVLDDRAGGLTHLLSSWSIDKARDLAWVNVEALWAVRRLSFLAESYADALAQTVGMVSRYLLTPVR